MRGGSLTGTWWFCRRMRSVAGLVTAARFGNSVAFSETKRLWGAVAVGMSVETAVFAQRANWRSVRGGRRRCTVKANPCIETAANCLAGRG